MAQALKIDLTVQGDALTAMTQAISIVKAIGVEYLQVKVEDFYVTVSKDSRVVDLGNIINLEIKTRKQEKEIAALKSKTTTHQSKPTLP
jgi:hypothetical protein